MKPQYEKYILQKYSIPASIILIAILGFVVYANSLNGAFIWDDNWLVEKNIYIRGPVHLADIFTTDLGEGGGEQTNFYRPIQMVSYMADYALWKLDVRGYHLTNILLHILSALSIYWLINVLYNDRLISLFTGLFFVVHPLHAEVVSYISGRTDSLSVMFMMFCFIFYIKALNSEKGKIYCMISLVSYALALLSRENSLVFPVLLLLYHYTFKKKLKATKYLPILSVAVIYIISRVTVLRFLLLYNLPVSTFWQRIPGFFVAITNYVRLIFLPFNLHMEYGNALFRLFDIKAVIGIFIVTGLLTYAFRKKNNKVAFFSISWFFLTLLPVSNIYPVTAYMSEHWLYLPSIGIFLIVAKGLSFLCRRERLKVFAVTFIAGLLIFYSVLTIKQNKYWNNPIIFYERTLKYAPGSEKMNYIVGKLYMNMGRTAEAIALYEKAIELSPAYADAYNNLGNIYNLIGNKEKAITLLEKAIEINPVYAAYHNNLAAVYYEAGNTEKAIASLKRAIEINPDRAAAYHSNLAIIYKGIGKTREAEFHENASRTFKSTIPDRDDMYTLSQLGNTRVQEKTVQYFFNTGLRYGMQGKHDEAIEEFKKAVNADGSFIQAYINLGNAYINKNAVDEAIENYKRAIDIEPGATSSIAYINLGAIYSNIKKDYAKAVEYLEKYIELNPGTEESKTIQEQVRILKHHLPQERKNHKGAFLENYP
ncbi:MAG: tetratricopeptide repeat protein [Candidatus Omnitrophota bacterium]